MEPNLIIPHTLAQAVLNYLARQPYSDVAQMIQALMQLQKAPETPAEAASE